MKAQLMIVLIGILATTATGCISQQDKDTVTQWQEFNEHLWAEQSPATSEAPVEVSAKVEDSAEEAQAEEAKADETKADETKADETKAEETQEDETQADQAEDAPKQPAASDDAAAPGQ